MRNEAGTSTLSPGDAFVTTTKSPSTQLVESAATVAEQAGIRFADRRRHSIDGLSTALGRPAGIVVGARDIRIFRGGKSAGYHPNMARQRVAALQEGQADRMASAMVLGHGDSVLDCTCGLASDAIVASHIVGPEGRVCAVESSAVLAAIVRYGLRVYDHRDPALVRAMRRVAVVHADSRSVISAMQPNSWDVVYFDPMFSSTLPESCGLELVRVLGVSGLPTMEVVDNARRVARRSVVVKDLAPGNLLKSLGIPVVRTVKRVWYGRLEV